MIFRYTAEKVLDGTQTQLRRPIRQRQRYTYAKGVTYAVQLADGKVTGERIKILCMSEQLLGAVTEDDANSEGYPNLAAFQHAWSQQYGHFDPSEDVWVVRFKLVVADHARFADPLETARENETRRGP